MNISFLRLGFTNLRRDWRAGQLRLLLLAVTLAVATLTAVSFFADRLNRGMQRDALQLLGGDAVVVSDQPTPAALQALAARQGLTASASLGFPTMARTSDAEGGSTRLVALKAVEAGYPLRGRLTASPREGGAPVATTDIPAPGEVWVDPSLLDALGTHVGSELLLGEARLRITRVIGVEPDRGGGFINFAPRVLMNRADLAATDLVQPASRVNYRYAVAAKDGAAGEAEVRRFVAQAKDWIEAEQARGTRVEALDGGRPELSNTLERAEKFLQLVALLAALLSAVAVGLAARAFANAHLDSCAMLRVLGLSQGTIARAHALEFLLVGLGGGLLGAALGWAAHHVFVLLLAGLVDAALPAPGLWPVGFGLGVGLTLMTAFGLPPVLQLARVPALRVIRRDVGEPRPLSLGVLGLGLAGFATLLLVASRDWTLGLITVGGFALAVGVFACAAWGAVLLLRRVVREDRAPRWLILATRQLSARPIYAVLQVSSLAIGLLALLLLALLRTDLIDSWRKATPVNAPNRFVINIQPDQAQDFQAALARAGVAADHDWYPMIRGRLVAVNDRPVQAEDYQDDRAQRLVEREFNLSYSAQVPAHNPIVAGRWTNEDQNGISMEDGIAETLGLKLGDRLRFDIAGLQHETTITSLREVDWGSMRANFFALYPVSSMPDLPVTYLAAFRAPEGNGRFDSQLVREFPNVTVVDLSMTLAQVQQVLAQVSRAVEFLFGFTLAAGLIVLYAAVASTREERAREYAVMRAVGAGGALLRQMQRAELLGLGLLAGVLAAIVSGAVGWALARFVFNFEWGGSLWLLPVGGLSGTVLALGAGWWGLRSVLRAPVVDTLRKAAA
jgi:putative ABC transport system permease protein